MKHLLKTSVPGPTQSATLCASTVAAAEPVATWVDQSQWAVGQKSRVIWKNVPTQTITAGDVTFAYRELGKHNGGTPVVFLTHLAKGFRRWTCWGFRWAAWSPRKSR